MNSIEAIFNRDLITSKVISDLYNPKELGIIVIPDFLNPEFCDSTYRQVLENKAIFDRAPSIEGRSRQALDIFYFQEENKEKSEVFTNVKRLREEYSFLCKWIARLANFRQPSVLNSVGIHHYEGGSLGMDLHRDYSLDTNLISSMVIKGSSPFYGYTDKDGNGKIEFKANTGSLILLRAPRHEGEKELRPYHSVGSCEEDRMTVLFRQRKPTSFPNA